MSIKTNCIGWGASAVQRNYGLLSCSCISINKMFGICTDESVSHTEMLLYRIQTKENHIEGKREFLVLHSLIYSPRFYIYLHVLFFSFFSFFMHFHFIYMLCSSLFRFTFQKKSQECGFVSLPALRSNLYEYFLWVVLFFFLLLFT